MKEEVYKKNGVETENELIIDELENDKMNNNEKALDLLND